MHTHTHAHAPKIINYSYLRFKSAVHVYYMCIYKLGINNNNNI
jgi:hypothetical protein